MRPPPSSRTPPTAKGGNNPPFAVGGGRTRLPHSPTAKGGPTLHGGWAYVHGGQSPISPQLNTNVLPPPAVFSCGNRNVRYSLPPITSDTLVTGMGCSHLVEWLLRSRTYLTTIPQISSTLPHTGRHLGQIRDIRHFQVSLIVYIGEGFIFITIVMKNTMIIIKVIISPPSSS